MTGEAPERGGRAGFAVLTAAAAVALAILLGLGTWQVKRAQWKADLIAAIAARAEAPPAPLPATASEAEDEFRRVRFTATFDHAHEAQVYGSQPEARGRISGPGAWIFTPARTEDGRLVMVDRGFVPADRQDPARRPEGQLQGTVTIEGLLRWPEAGNLFTPADTPEKNLFFLRDHRAIATAKGLADPGPFYVQVVGAAPPGGLPQPALAMPKLPDNHFGYALTWYGLAATLVGVYLALFLSRRRARA